MANGPELWRGLYAGMTEEEVSAAHPEEKFELAPDCRVKLKPRFRDDRLVAVNVNAQWRAAYNDCGKIVLDSLVAQYGAPEDVDAYRSKSDEWFDEDAVIWLDGQRSITLALYKNGRFKALRYQLHFEQSEKLIEGL